MMWCISTRRSVMKVMLTRGIKTTKHSIKGFKFKITNSQANEIFQNNDNFLTKNKKGVATIDKTISKKYIPMHGADIYNIKPTFSARYGIDRTEYDWIVDSKGIPHMIERIETDWYIVSGTLSSIYYPLGIPQTQICATLEYPRKIINEALLYGNTQIDKESIQTFTDTNSVPHEIKIAYAFDLILKKIYDSESSRAQDYIRNQYNADHVEITTLDINLNQCDIKLFSYHIPAFVQATEATEATGVTENKVMVYRIINGLNGNIAGDNILSEYKMFMGGGILGIGVALLSTILFPVYRTQVLIVRGLFGFVAGGGVSGLWAKYRNVYRHYVFEKFIVNERNKNTEYVETAEDRRRRLVLGDMGDKEDDRGDADAQLYELLGLKNTKHTVADIRNAYLKQVKIWHPDMHDDKKNAEEKFKRINMAYEKLMEQFTKN